MPNLKEIIELTPFADKADKLAKVITAAGVTDLTLIDNLPGLIGTPRILGYSVHEIVQAIRDVAQEYVTQVEQTPKQPAPPIQVVEADDIRAGRGVLQQKQPEPEQLPEPQPARLLSAYPIRKEKKHGRK